MSFLSRQPKPVLALLGGGVAIAAYAISSGQWEGNMALQFLSVGMIAIGVLTMMSDNTPTPVSMTEVVKSNYKLVRNAQVDGRVPPGSLTSVMEARKVISDGVPVYWEHGVRVENREKGNPIYVMRTELTKNTLGKVDISGVTKKDKWKATDKPDIVVLEPPDMVTFMRLKRMEEDKKVGK